MDRCPKDYPSKPKLKYDACAQRFPKRNDTACYLQHKGWHLYHNGWYVQQNGYCFQYNWKSIYQLFRRQVGHGELNAPNSPTSPSKGLDWSKLKLFTQSTVRLTSKSSNH